MTCINKSVTIIRSNIKRIVKARFSFDIQCVNLSSISRDLSFALSGCGWLIPYHLGAISALRDHGCLPYSSKIAGTSGGAICALIGAADVDPKLALDVLINLSQNYKFKTNIDQGLKTVIKDLLPDDAVSRCNNRLFVTVTRAWPSPITKPTIISTFESNDDLLEVVTASCFIPLYSSRSQVFSQLRRGMYLDGGLFAFIPPVGDISITPFPKRYVIRRRDRRAPDISPDLSLTFRYSLPRLLTWVLQPAPPVILRDLFEEGRKCTDNWLQKNSLQHQHHHHHHHQKHQEL